MQTVDLWLSKFSRSILARNHASPRIGYFDRVNVIRFLYNVPKIMLYVLRFKMAKFENLRCEVEVELPFDFGQPAAPKRPKEAAVNNRAGSRAGAPRK